MGSLSQLIFGSKTAGISKAPEALQSSAAMRNWYADGIHMIAYPVSGTQISWAITQREAKETAETWRPYRQEELPHQKAQLSELLDGWDPAVGEMIGAAERIIKFGLFDRTELHSSQWYSKRSVLVGDAAHPTSPHLGQGANQAL
jgi:salicylate hydroxylase